MIDGFPEELLGPLFSDASSPSAHAAGMDGEAVLEVDHAAEVLPIGRGHSEGEGFHEPIL